MSKKKIAGAAVGIVAALGSMFSGSSTTNAKNYAKGQRRERKEQVERVFRRRRNDTSGYSK